MEHYWVSVRISGGGETVEGSTTTLPHNCDTYALLDHVDWIRHDQVW